MLGCLFNETVNIERLADGTGNVEEYDSHISSLSCAIQPLDDSYTEDIDGNFGKNWLMLCSAQDILEGDKVINGSTEYRVVAVKSLDFIGESHMEIVIRHFNS